MQLAESKSYAVYVLNLLTYIKDLDKLDCMTEQQLEDIKKMKKWSNSAKKSESPCYNSRFLDESGRPVLLYQTPEWFENKFVSLDTLEPIDKKHGYRCDFCDSWVKIKGDCAYCNLGRCL